MTSAIEPGAIDEARTSMDTIWARGMKHEDIARMDARDSANYGIIVRLLLFWISRHGSYGDALVVSDGFPRRKGIRFFFEIHLIYFWRH
jgi:hypothetical protein